jgi:hypothetical protein
MIPARLYTAFAGMFLLVQGVSTLAFRLWPPLDRGFPALLATTRMMPPHSILHIVTGILALIVLFRGGRRGSLWFAVGFGAYYLGLAIFGITTGQPTIFGLQPFDHPFHLLLGGLGLGAAGFTLYRTYPRKRAPL